MVQTLSLTPAQNIQNLATYETYRFTLRRIALFMGILISGGNLAIPRLPLVMGCTLAALAVINPMNLFRREMAAIWLLLAVTLVVAVVGGDGFNISAIAIRYANFVSAVTLLAAYVNRPRGTLERDLLPLLMLFAGQAVATPIIALLLGRFFWTFQIEETVYHTLGYIFTYHDTVRLAGALKRPDGFFYEPGVMQIYCNFYLFVALFSLRNLRHAGFAIAAVLASQSTTGLIIAFFLAATAYLQHLKDTGVSQRIIVLILMPVVLLPLALIVAGNIEDKLFGAMSGSSSARKYDLITGLRIIGQHWLFGIGFDHNRYLDIAARLGYFESVLPAESLYGRASSNGLVTWCYMVGVPLFLVYMWSLYRQRFFPQRLIFFTFLSLAFAGEALVGTTFFLVFILSGSLVTRTTYMRKALRPRRTFSGRGTEPG